MASQLKVDALTGVTTAGSISVTGEGNSTTTNLQQGLAKVWVDISGSGSPVIDNSLNAASVTDVGAGNRAINFTNNVSNANYALLAGMIKDPNTNGNRGASGHQLESQITSKYQYFTYYGSDQNSGGGVSDEIDDSSSVLGDLA